MATVEPELDLLAPTPSTGHLIGYARTSRRNQNLDRQINALTTAGCNASTKTSSPAKTPPVPG